VRGCAGCLYGVDAHDAVHAVDALGHAIAFNPKLRQRVQRPCERRQPEQPVAVIAIVGWKFR